MSDAKDRNGCHPDCGKTQREHALSEHDSMEPGWAMDIAGERIYCTAACRDARPIAAPEAAKPQHPERRAGQRWQVTYAKYRASAGVLELLDRNYSGNGWNCLNIENCSFPGWIHDDHWRVNNPQGATMTLIADAAAPEATGKAASGLSCAACGRSTDVCKFACTDRGDCVRNGCPSHGLPAPLPAGKVEAAKAVCTGFKGCANAPVSRMVTALAPKRAVRVDWCDTCYRLHERPSAFGGVYAGDISELPERLSRPRLSYQPMDDSFAEDC